MVGSVGQSTAAADAEVDKVRYTRKITPEEKEAMAAVIKGFVEYNNNSEDPQDKETGRMLLRKLEDDAEFNAQMWARAMKKEPTDDNKFGYYNAVADFELISELTGKDSPAKAAKKLAAIAAAAEKARNEVAVVL